MELLEINGLVIRSVDTGEGDRLLTLLTAEKGKMTVTARGAALMKSKTTPSTGLFAYSTFMLRKPTKYYYISETSYITSFESVRYDIDRFAVASYICDIACDISLEDTPDDELLSLTLNALYALDKLKDMPCDKIKAAYELKAAASAGFLPDVSACGVCRRELNNEECTLDVMNGRLLCRKCRTEIENSPEYLEDDSTAKIMIRVTPQVRLVMDYILQAGTKKYLSFHIDEISQQLLSVICERYLINHLEHSFNSLAYYKELKESMNYMLKATEKRKNEQ